MTRNPWTRTTRTASRLRRAPSAPYELLAGGEIVRSPETGLQYRVERLIGAGGFGRPFWRAGSMENFTWPRSAATWRKVSPAATRRSPWRIVSVMPWPDDFWARASRSPGT